MIVVTIIGIFVAIAFISETKYFLFCKCASPWMFLPVDIPSEYWIEHVTFGHLYVMFRFSTRKYYRGVSVFANDYPCVIWCRGLNTCLLYIGLLFGNIVWKYTQIPLYFPFPLRRNLDIF